MLPMAFPGVKSTTPPPLTVSAQAALQRMEQAASSHSLAPVVGGRQGSQRPLSLSERQGLGFLREAMTLAAQRRNLEAGTEVRDVVFTRLINQMCFPCMCLCFHIRFCGREDIKAN